MTRRFPAICLGLSLFGCSVPADPPCEHAGQCHYSQLHCIVFWKVGDREFMGGGTLPCAQAKAYVELRKKESTQANYWYREIWVNTIIDPAAQCMEPAKFHAPAAAVQAVPAKS